MGASKFEASQCTNPRGASLRTLYKEIEILHDKCNIMTPTVKSLYEQLGGQAAVYAAVDIFYRKVLSDDRISHFFDGVDMDRQAAQQKAFLTMVFGGPNRYNGKDMRQAHAKLVSRGLNGSHFDAVVENLGATLSELGVRSELIQQVAALAATTRNDVLGC